MKDLEEAEAAHRAAAKAFAEAVETSAEHVVEVNREEATAFREQVLELAGRVSGSTAASELETARGAFRGELREYSRKAGQRVQRMREELSAAAEAMRVVAESVTTSSGEHETVLRREFSRLRDAAESEDVREVRASVHATVDTVTNSFEALKRSNAMNLAQLRDEIRVLQDELQKERKKDAPVGLASKESLDKEIEALLRQDRPFTVAVIGVPEQQALYGKYPQACVDAALATMLANLFALARKHGVSSQLIAPLQNGVYALTLPPRTDVNGWRDQLSLSSAFQADGLPRMIRIAPRVEAVERLAGEPHAKFFDRLSHSAATVLATKLGHEA